MPGIFKVFRGGEGRISTSGTYFAQKNSCQDMFLCSPGPSLLLLSLI